MKRNFITAVLMTIITTVLLGLVYPFAVYGLAQLIFPDQANGSLIYRDNQIVGSRLIGQPFAGPGYFASRPSAAGPAGYDAGASTGSNLGPTSSALIERVNTSVARLQAANDKPNTPVPVDLVTASGSGLDPHISIAAAEFQAASIARTRDIPVEEVQRLIRQSISGRQFGFLGEPTVNVLELNLELDRRFPRTTAKDEGGRRKDERANLKRRGLPASSFILHPSSF